ncbi:hypothetical protein C0992_005451 [Termitomyces sp. T32_za158]|nr:hypothetical protein C0992_005451 [Termitomyces sp. T32_za158]
MAPLPSRKSLETMKRVDLQRLCKDYGVKANLKSEALIDLLIDTAKPPAASLPTRLSISTRQSSRAGPSRISSIVIHDIDQGEEDKTSANYNLRDHNLSFASTSHQEPSPPLATRTRKRKEQARLGVGRPVVAGGTGPRAVTKSLSLTKGKRGKASRALKPSETTITEEVEENSYSVTQGLSDEVASQKGRSSQTLEKQPSPGASIDSLATVDKHVADALRPLHDQIKSMKSELELMQALKAEVGELRARMDEMGSLKEKVASLTAIIRDLREGAGELTDLRLDSDQCKETILMRSVTTPSTPKVQSPARESGVDPSKLGVSRLPAGTVFRRSSDLPAAAGSTNLGLQPGYPPSMLGKRDRDSTASFIDNDQDIGQTIDETVQMEPSGKRIKLSLESMDDYVSQEGGTDGGLVVEERTNDVFRGSSFKVFSGVELSPMELVDPPPPIESLPDFFATSPLASETSMIPRGNRATSTANATENQPSAFSFQHIISSTPAHGMFMPSFPYPEPPQSPSPAGTSTIGLLSQQQSGRSDAFQAFGLPQPGRSSRTTGLRNTSGLPSSFIDPATLERQTSNNGGGGESDARPADTSSSIEVGVVQSSHMKRTMYGTELDGDTRFGDFGLEGVGNAKGGFWAGGKF